MDSTLYSTRRAGGALLAMAGMALQWACLHSVTFASSVFPLDQAAAEPIWPVNSLTTFLLFVIIFLFGRRVPALVGSRKVCACTFVCLVVGYSMFATVCVAIPNPSLLLVSSVLMACGTTPLIVMWGETFKYLSPQNEQLFVTLGGIVCSIGLYLVETLCPLPLAVAMFVAMPLSSVSCLIKAKNTFEKLATTWVAHSHGAVRRSPSLFYICIAAFSIPCNYLRENPDMQVIIQEAAVWQEVLAVTIVMMLVIALSEVAAERHGMLLVPSIVLFLMLAAMLVHLLPRDSGGQAAPYLLYAGYYLFLAMIYLALGPIAATTATNPARLFSGAMIANVGGLLVGSVLGRLGETLGPTGATGIVLGVAAVILLVGIMLYSNRSYSIFRINYFDEDEYSFEYVVPLVPADSQSAQLLVHEPSSMLDAITAGCDNARDRYGLSAREHDVLVELVRGRTIATIATQLDVSENTVKAHTKAIYRKLDVHTREELLTQVEKSQ